MSENKSNRIAKNTFYLYVRMFLALLISLYTSRVILEALGVEDFGIYNVVGGIVIMFNVICASFAESTSRFFAFELGKNNNEELVKLFYNSKTIHLLMGILVVIGAEIIGSYFIEYKLVIPESRLAAAKVVLHTSIASFAIKLIATPYRALIIAHERMGFYAVIGLLEVLIKLIIAVVVLHCNFDRLATYSTLLLLDPILILLLSAIYAKSISADFKILTYKFHKSRVGNLASFAGWDSLGALERIMLDQGLNILINTFFNPVINAARGIAFQVKNAIAQFGTNFQVATAPQITKSYAENDLSYMHRLIENACRYSFFLLLLPIVPFIAHADFWLSIWLKEVPSHASLFVQYSLIYILIDSPYEILNQGAKASGKLKKFRIFTCLTSLLNLPICYFALSLGMQAEGTVVISCFIGVLVVLVQLLVLRKTIGLSIMHYLKHVTLKCYMVAAILLFMVFIASYYIDFTSIYMVILSTILYLILTGSAIWYIGINRAERYYIISFIKRKLA